MKTINQLLDIAKEVSSLSSDRKLAAALGTGSMTRYRKGHEIPSDPTAIKLAGLCKMKPEVVVAICHKAKAKTPEESNVWQHIYKMAAAGCLVLVMSASVLMPVTSEASTSKSYFSSVTSYPLCDVIIIASQRDINRF